jgi:hypothetical protein
MTCRMTDKPKMQMVLAKKECVPQKENEELKKKSNYATQYYTIN